MSGTKYLKIAIAEPSTIIRLGIESMLKRLNNYKVQILWLSEDNGHELTEISSHLSADIYILNPIICGLHPRSFNIPEESKTVAIISTFIHKCLLKEYDDVLELDSSLENVQDIIGKLMDEEKSSTPVMDTQTLTNREKEIVVCVVKGMTNKEIADALFLSTHTVITHRRNISKKLQIHSPSGLTIYAIMNKLVQLDEINS
ncbi:response regulator transcription factor [Porphyromonas pogonae]|uniref:response regulator transcription factor n=1 Tax=Porphyromonas pogonae TaxID=867595 RepID=UPI002E791CF7|nr:response regulator transcription factor [Porphyromonas pogonae]